MTGGRFRRTEKSPCYVLGRSWRPLQGDNHELRVRENGSGERTGTQRRHMPSHHRTRLKGDASRAADGRRSEPCALESVESAEKLLQLYDKDTQTWGYQKRERFWDAVTIAHQQSRRGRGVSIAIVDGSFDLAYDSIARRATFHDPTPAPGGLAHGTAVALLVAEVAPEAELHLYEVCDPDGVPIYARICEAIAAAAERSADIVTLSVGRYQTHDQDPDRHGGSAPVAYSGSGGSIEPGSECELCRVAAEAAKDGISVVAAAGNRNDLVFCPSRSDAAIACGFRVASQHRMPTPDGGWTVEAAASAPEHQGRWLDFDLQQAPGVLGTSYATPLIAGFLALCEQRDTIPGFLECGREASAATLHERMLSNGLVDESHLPAIRERYRRAFEVLPHQHDIEDDPCPECSLFAEIAYANRGRFFLHTGRMEEARRLLLIGRSVLPRSPHVAGNLGAVLRHQADGESEVEARRALLEEAEGLYESASASASEESARDRYGSMAEEISRLRLRQDGDRS